MVTSEQKRIIRALKTLEKSWPTDGLMIMANGNFLYLCTKHPESGGKVLESFYIPNDGGDPDWSGDSSDVGQKKLPQFRPPRQLIGTTKYSDLGIGPPPRVSGRED